MADSSVEPPEGSPKFAFDRSGLWLPATSLRSAATELPQQTPTRLIRILSRHLDSTFLRQTPRGSGIWQDSVFAINGDNIDADAVIVFDDIARAQKIHCPSDKIIFIAGEPPAIKTYDQRFLAQFRSVVTCHSDTPHPHAIESHAASPWFVGVDLTDPTRPRVAMSFDDICAARPAKSKLLSIIAGRTTLTPGHQARARLIEALQRRFGRDIDVFMRETNPFGDKWEVVAPYKYHVVLENSRFPHYWTEKLADAYLADAYPLYWGCPNLDAYFACEGLTEINLFDVDDAVARIADAILRQRYEATRDIREADRQKLLYHHNFFALAARLVGPPSTSRAETVVIEPERHFTDSPLRKARKRLKRAVPRRWRPARWKV